jgi:nucleotide-binding universal stress UspA family protein
VSRPDGPIVVGVSPSTGSPAALRWAADEARLRATRVRAVMAWRPPRAPAAPGGRPPATVVSVSGTDYEAVADEKLRRLVAAALGAGDAVECQAVRGNAVTALLAAARDAQLVVVGEPGAGRLATVRTSLIAPLLIAQAPCPVVAMPNAFAAKRWGRVAGTSK